MTLSERVWLGLFVAVVTGVAVTWQLARSFGLEPWVPAVGLAGGVVVTPWVWYQTRAKF